MLDKFVLSGPPEGRTQYFVLNTISGPSEEGFKEDIAKT